MTKLDLTGLDKFSNFLQDPKTSSTSVGAPLDLPIDAIDEDPDQPRKNFAADALEELAESIRSRGVKQPISVRTAPEQDGRYIINHGARRFRASRLAELDTIPAFVDANHGDIDQLAENIQRENLDTREIIDGIGELLAKGRSNAWISKELGKSKAWVSKYTKLQNMPAVIGEALATGRCKDADALGILIRCWELDEVAVTQVLTEAEGTIVKLDADRLRGRLERAGRAGGEPNIAGSPPAATVQALGGTAQTVHDMNTSGTSGGDADHLKVVKEPDLDHVLSENGVDVGLHDGASEKKTGSERIDGAGQGEAQNVGAVNDLNQESKAPAKIKKPQVQVKVGRREAIVLLAKPCEYGLAWVGYEDGSEELLDANRLKLVAITDGKKT